MELPDEPAEELLAEPETANDQEPIADQEAPEELLDRDEMADEEGQGDDAPAEQLAVADGTEEPDDEHEEEQPEDKRLKVFISYNRNPNDSMVAARIYDELSKDYDVFLDTEMLPGAPWAEFTEDWLDAADTIIALISSESVNAPFVMAELQRAYERYKTDRRPNIISVRIAFAGLNPLRLDAFTSHFQALPWDNQNYAWLFERLRAGLSKRPLPLQEPLVVGTDIIHISDTLRKKHAETFVEPRELAREPVSFEEKRLLWITGDATVRNYVAVSVGALTNSKSLYEISNLRKWSEINNTYISDSTIFLRDALPAQYLHESGAIGEWHSLRAILERNNIVIATAPDDEFERLEQELLRYQFTDYQLRRVGPYTEEAKMAIFANRVDHMLVNGELDEDKHGWALDLAKDPNEAAAISVQGRERAIERRQREMRKQFTENIRRWSPADIESFVLRLSQVRSQSDIARLLKRSAAIDEEIRSWFVALDDSTRCFVATVALFADSSSEVLWEQYKQIVEHLRRFDQELRLLPFGICRKRAYPYISADGPIRLDERAADAIRQEVARSYREYFVELIPKFKEWSVPPGRNPKTIQQRNQRKPKIEETRKARTAIAQMVGIAARFSLDDLSEILEYWATDPNIQIRKSVAFAFTHTAKTPTSVTNVLNLLEKWCLDLNSNDPVPWRALAAADALGEFTAAADDPYVTSRALQCLRAFARSRRKSARFYASIALRRVARYAPLSSIEGMLKRLARDERTEVRLNVAAALNEARARKHDEAVALIDLWTHSFDPNRRWVALCGIVTERQGEGGEFPNQHDRLLSLLEDQDTAKSLGNVLGETVTADRYGQTARHILEFLARGTQTAAWTNLATGLSDLTLNKLDHEILPLVRFPEAPPFEERAIDVRREVLRKNLDAPPQLLSILKTWLSQEHSKLELFRALTQLLDDGLDNCRFTFIEAMAEQFRATPARVNEILAALLVLAPAHFDPIVQAIHSEAFRQSLEDPKGFVSLTNGQLANEETSAATREAIELLARDDPQGSREQMVRALLEAYAQAPQITKELILTLRTDRNPDLVRIAHEFQYRLIERAMSVPATFPSFAIEMIQNDGETMSLLNYLAAPEPQGNRAALVRALTDARLLGTTTADDLLALPAMKEWTNLVSLPAEVARSYYLRRIFSVRIVDKLFSKRYVEVA